MTEPRIYKRGEYTYTMYDQADGKGLMVKIEYGEASETIFMGARTDSEALKLLED